MSVVHISPAVEEYLRNGNSGGITLLIGTDFFSGTKAVPNANVVVGSVVWAVPAVDASDWSIVSEQAQALSQLLPCGQSVLGAFASAKEFQALSSLTASDRDELCWVPTLCVSISSSSRLSATIAADALPSSRADVLVCPTPLVRLRMPLAKILRCTAAVIAAGPGSAQMKQRRYIDMASSAGDVTCLGDDAEIHPLGSSGQNTDETIITCIIGASAPLAPQALRRLLTSYITSTENDSSSSSSTGNKNPPIEEGLRKIWRKRLTICGASNSTMLPPFDLEFRCASTSAVFPKSSGELASLLADTTGLASSSSSGEKKQPPRSTPTPSSATATNTANCAAVAQAGGNGKVALLAAIAVALLALVLAKMIQ